MCPLDIECFVHVALPKWPISQLKTGAKSLLSNIYTVLAGVKTHNKQRLDI